MKGVLENIDWNKKIMAFDNEFSRTGSTHVSVSGTEE